MVIMSMKWLGRVEVFGRVGKKKKNLPIKISCSVLFTFWKDVVITFG